MWIVTGVLLGLVGLAALCGFHFGPHARAVAAAIGLLVAGWLTYALLDAGPGRSLWWLLGADLLVSAGVAALAWFGLARSRGATERYHLSSLEGSLGTVVSELAPEGVIRVGGEQWSAVSVNGTAPASSRVQVIRVARRRRQPIRTDPRARTVRVRARTPEPNSTLESRSPTSDQSRGALRPRGWRAMGRRACSLNNEHAHQNNLSMQKEVSYRDSVYVVVAEASVELTEEPTPGTTALTT